MEKYPTSLKRAFKEKGQSQLAGYSHSWWLHCGFDFHFPYFFFNSFFISVFIYLPVLGLSGSM